jgi:elongation factor P--(R)-beta-lysine ligase
MSDFRPRPPWHPEMFAGRRPALMARLAVLRAMRRWFEEAGFLEVETPALQVSPGMEPHLGAFATEIREHGAPVRRTLRLHTSPELAMKKLLVAGAERIFQFARVFRNGERSATHHPEFTMLEWYRAGAGWRDLVDDCRPLLRAVSAAGGGGFRWCGAFCDPDAEWELLSVEEAFRRETGIAVLDLADDVAAFRRAAEAVGIATGADDAWDDVFFRIFLDRIEPRLGLGRPTVLHGWPARMAALARIDPADPRTAERFELYVAGLELANAFGELTDAAEQRRRFEADRALKRRLSGEAWPIDEDFLAALGHGMPASAGIALGFDRLVMLATGAERIEDVLWLPVAGLDEIP